MKMASFVQSSSALTKKVLSKARNTMFTVGVGWKQGICHSVNGFPKGYVCVKTNNIKRAHGDVIWHDSSFQQLCYTK